MKLTVSFLVALGFSIPCHTSDAFHAFPCCAYFSNSRGTTHGVACGVARVVLESCQFSLRPSYIVKKTHACTKQDDAAIPKHIEQQTIQIWNIKSEKYFDCFGDLRSMSLGQAV